VLSRPIPGEDFEAILRRHEIDPFDIITPDQPEIVAPADDEGPADEPVRSRPMFVADGVKPNQFAPGPLEFVAPTDRVDPPKPAKPAIPAFDQAPLVAAAVGVDEPVEAIGAADRRGAPTLPRLREYRPTDTDAD
jgi:hypothetical protein